MDQTPSDRKMRLQVLSQLICELCKEVGMDPKQAVLNARARAGNT